MAASWKKKPGFDVDRVLLAIGQLRQVDNSGRVSFVHDHYWEDYKHLIADAVKCNHEITPEMKRQWVISAIGRLDPKTPVKHSAFITEMRKLESQYLSQAMNKFLLLTEITMPFHDGLRKTCISGCYVSFRKYRDARFAIPAKTKHAIEKRTTGFEHAKNRTFVRISTQGRTELQAGERAIEALTLLRAFWNLFINYGIWSSQSMGYRPAINKIISGPIYTLHRPNGKMANDRFWYEREFAPSRHNTRFVNNWSEIEKTRKHWTVLLKQSRYRENLEELLRRYVLALDDPDYEAAYLKLWSVLESLTATKAARYDDTVQRAIWLHKDQQHHRDVLEYLKRQRNEQVHQSKFEGDVEQSVFMLKRYVEQLLLFHLNSRFGFESSDEAARLLDLPRDEAALKRSEQLLNEVRQWIKADES